MHVHTFVSFFFIVVCTLTIDAKCHFKLWRVGLWLAPTLYHIFAFYAEIHITLFHGKLLITFL